MSELVEQVKAAIAERMAPAIDARAPYAKVMFDLCARKAVALTIEACANAASTRRHHSGLEIAEAIRALVDEAEEI